MHFDARVCGFCRPLTLLCWHDVSDIFSYYRLFVDDLIDTLGLKLYIHTCTYIYIYAYMYDVHTSTCIYIYTSSTIYGGTHDRMHTRGTL